MLALGCVGQSGNEGSMPGPPCASGAALIVGRIQSVGGGCVSVEVERVLAPGQATISGSDGQVLFDGNPHVGDTLHGPLETVYAYSHEFHPNDAVATLVFARGSDIAMEVFPRDGDSVKLQWSGREFKADMQDLTSPDCSEKLAMLREAGKAIVTNQSAEMMTAAPAPAPNCAP